MNSPIINIQYAYLMEEIFIKLIKINQGEEWVPPSRETLLDKTKDHQLEWNKYSEKILEGLEKHLELEFSQKEIDVYTVPGTVALSEPLIIGANIKSEIFVDILTHELIHRILNRNNRNLDLITIWGGMFPNVKERLVRNHILVHAIHKYIYLDVLDLPQHFEMDVSKSQDYPAYKRSWEIVEKDGYENLIEKFKSNYL